MDAELTLLEKARRQEAVGLILEHRLLPSFVRWERAAKVIVDHHLRFGGAVIPTEELVRKIPDWPEDELHQTEMDQPVEFYLESFKTQALHSGATGLLSVAATALKRGDPHQAVAALRSGLLTLDDLTRSAKETDLVRSGPSRWEEYQRRKAANGIIGIPFPWETLTEQTGGMQNGTLSLFIGRTGIGKSMTVMLMAEKARAAGFRPLVFPLEMTDIQWGIRWDAYRLMLPFDDIRLGRLDDAREAAYQSALLKDVPEDEPGYIVVTDDEHSSLSGIAAKIEEYQPDFVLIDGIYLLADDQGAEGWEGHKNVSNGLKKLARRTNLPFALTTQFTAEVGKAKMDCDVDRDLAYGKALRQDCDNIIGLFQDQDLEDAAQMLARLKKFREGRPMELMLNWNWATGDFSEAPMYAPPPPESGETAPPPSGPKGEGKSVDF